MREKLLQDQAELQASLAGWQRKLQEAQRQIQVHLGHLDRIQIMLDYLQSDNDKTDVGGENGAA